MTKRVLLIKMTSMGDLMHTLPALTDAAAAIPGIQFDWVADEAFAEIPSWHRAVNQVINSAHRRWKKNLRQAWHSGELKAFYQQLNAQRYDAVVDSQSNLKSAAVALLRRCGSQPGPVHGLDAVGVREKPAHWVYQQRHSSVTGAHAIAQQRALMAAALGYQLPSSAPNFAIDRSQLTLPELELPQRYLFFVHNASWQTKLWPEQHWQALIEQATQAGYSVLLPSGNEQELQRAQRLAATSPLAHALPRLSLSAIAAIMDGALAAVCCDTGLGHLAAVLDLPAVHFYGATDVALIGAQGPDQQHIIASSEHYPCAPCYLKQCRFPAVETAACMDSFRPQQVWQALLKIPAVADIENSSTTG